MTILRTVCTPIMREWEQRFSAALWSQRIVWSSSFDLVEKLLQATWATFVKLVDHGPNWHLRSVFPHLKQDGLAACCGNLSHSTSPQRWNTIKWQIRFMINCLLRSFFSRNAKMSLSPGCKICFVCWHFISVKVMNIVLNKKQQRGRWGVYNQSQNPKRVCTLKSVRCRFIRFKPAHVGTR